jgi:hypothetical protein
MKAAFVAGVITGVIIHRRVARYTRRYRRAVAAYRTTVLDAAR